MLAVARVNFWPDWKYRSVGAVHGESRRRLKNALPSNCHWTLTGSIGVLLWGMNVSLVKSAPTGDFAVVSALMTGWQSKLHRLASQKQPINYDFYPLPGIPSEVRQHLEEEGYTDLVLENDRWQHYLIPAPQE
jgi:hypothetical protein